MKKEYTVIIERDEAGYYVAEVPEIYGCHTQAKSLQLTKGEKEEVVTNCDHLSRIKYSPVLPNVFTEHGAIMAANALNS